MFSKLSERFCRASSLKITVRTVIAESRVPKSSSALFFNRKNLHTYLFFQIAFHIARL
jgi:hypothetical protein